MANAWDKYSEFRIHVKWHNAYNINYRYNFCIHHFMSIIHPSIEIYIYNIYISHRFNLHKISRCPTFCKKNRNPMEASWQCTHSAFKGKEHVSSQPLLALPSVSKPSDGKNNQQLTTTRTRINNQRLEKQEQ